MTALPQTPIHRSSHVPFDFHGLGPAVWRAPGT
jgi:hypothetical protein